MQQYQERFNQQYDMEQREIDSLVEKIKHNNSIQNTLDVERVNEKAKRDAEEQFMQQLQE